MKSLGRWLVVGLATLSLSIGVTPHAAAQYFNNDIWESVLGVRNLLADCNEVKGPVFLTESGVAFASAQAVGTDEAIHFFATTWESMPENVQQSIDGLQTLIDQGISYGYKMEAQKQCLATIKTYGVSNVANALPVAARAIVNSYAEISVDNGQVIVTPKSDRVTVVSALLDTAGSPVVTIQVTDAVNGQLYSYTSQYPAIVPPADPGSDPVPLTSFSKTRAPTISGTAKVGKTLKAHVKAWSPKTTLRTYQWYRNGVLIEGATHSSYKLVGLDYRKKITVKVTGTRSGYTPTSRTSKATKSVKATTQPRGTVRVVGTLRVGQTVSAKTSRWSSTAVLHYQWYRSGHKIVGATGKTYTLTALDKGKKLKVKVTATKLGYKTTSRTSKYTSKVKAGIPVPPPTPPPTPEPTPTPEPSPTPTPSPAPEPAPSPTP